MYIDSHAHLTSEQVLQDLEPILKRAQEQKVEKIVNICTDPASLKEGLKLRERYPWIFNAAATTPHDVEKEGELFFPLVAEAAQEGRLVAIGETGLDYYYEHSPREVQQEYLVRYFHLALQENLPVIIHCRDAFRDLFAIADSEYPSSRLLLHCFTGTVEEATKALDRGWFLSFSGIVTFKKSQDLREALKITPLDRLLVETDTPYLAPQSKRGSPNEPSFLPEIVSLVAHVKEIDLTTAAQMTAANASAFFCLTSK